MITELSGLKVDQTIDYKSASENVVSVGKVVEFKQIGEAGWANIKDAVTGQTEWISLLLWQQYRAAGLFNNLKNVNNATGIEPQALPGDAF